MGFIIIFFQSNALTVGIMKKGEMSNTRTMPLPKKSRLTNNAMNKPKVMVINNTEPTKIIVFDNAGQNIGSV